MTALDHTGEDTAADSPASSSGATSAPLPYSVSGATGPLSPDELALTDAWWRLAARHLATAQLLEEQEAATPVARAERRRRFFRHD